MAFKTIQWFHLAVGIKPGSLPWSARPCVAGPCQLSISPQTPCPLQQHLTATLAGFPFPQMHPALSPHQTFQLETDMPGGTSTFRRVAGPGKCIWRQMASSRKTSSLLLPHCPRQPSHQQKLSKEQLKSVRTWSEGAVKGEAYRDGHRMSFPN